MLNNYVRKSVNVPNNEIVELFSEIFHLKSKDPSLMPLPSKTFKAEYNKKENIKFYNCERNAVAIRRNEYVRKMKSNSNPRINSAVGYIIKIQRKWKSYLKRTVLPKLILLQKRIKLYLYRKGISRILFLLRNINSKISTFNHIVMKKFLETGFGVLLNCPPKKIFISPFPLIRDYKSISKVNKTNILYTKSVMMAKCWKKMKTNRMKRILNKRETIMSAFYIRQKVFKSKIFIESKQNLLKKIIRNTEFKINYRFFEKLRNHFKSKYILYITYTLTYIKCARFFMVNLKDKRNYLMRIFNKIANKALVYAYNKLKEKKNIIRKQIESLINKTNRSLSFRFLSAIRRRALQSKLLKDLTYNQDRKMLKYKINDWRIKSKALRVV